MKGYAILTMLVSLVVLALPPMTLHGQTAQQTNVQLSPATVSVRHTDETIYTDIDIRKLVLYETAAQIAYDAPKEAIKAQAVACYTLLCYRQLHESAIESTCLPFPSSYSEDYWKATLGEKYEEAMNAYQTALAEVSGKQLVFDKEPIMALSHTVNNGTTENGEILLGQSLPYLKAVASPADTASPARSATVTVSLSDATERLTTLLGSTPPADASAWFGQSAKTKAGTVQSITVCGQMQTGYALQQAFSLPSAAFDVTLQGENVVFSTHGQGHLVGMSTYGAIAMANDGQTYDQILTHYYADATLL